MQIARRTPQQAMDLLARETRTRPGEVPRSLAGVDVADSYRAICDGHYLFWSDSGFGYHYVPGDGIAIARPRKFDPDEEVLWLNGSVYAAVACLNGFLPLHASAVAQADRVIAFTGPAGAGKSTIVAGLGNCGLPMFCDDTLLIDLANIDRAICMPGHKRLKLLGDALALTGAQAEQPVGAGTGKQYAAPPAGDVGVPLPLDTLVFLEEGDDLRWEPIAGSERFTRLEDDHYTQQLFLDAAGPTRAELFAIRARLAAQVRMYRLVRPRSAQGFAASVELAATRIAQLEAA